MDTEDDVLQWWSDDSQALYSLFAERGEKALQLLKTDPNSGQTEEILREWQDIHRGQPGLWKPP